MKKLCCLLLCLLPTPILAGGIYKCFDGQGHPTYTNDAGAANRNNCQPLNIDAAVSSVSGVSRSSGGAVPRASIKNNAGPADFPKVNDSTQRQRDQGRRKILEDELAGEMKALEAARATYKQQAETRTPEEAKDYKKYLERIGPYKDEVTAHEKNIEALKKELERTK